MVVLFPKQIFIENAKKKHIKNAKLKSQINAFRKFACFTKKQPKKKDNYISNKLKQGNKNNVYVTYRCSRNYGRKIKKQWKLTKYLCLEHVGILSNIFFNFLFKFLFFLCSWVVGEETCTYIAQQNPDNTKPKQKQQPCNVSSRREVHHHTSLATFVWMYH